MAGMAALANRAERPLNIRAASSQGVLKLDPGSWAVAPRDCATHLNYSLLLVQRRNADVGVPVATIVHRDLPRPTADFAVFDVFLL